MQVPCKMEVVPKPNNRAIILLRWYRINHNLDCIHPYWQINIWAIFKLFYNAELEVVGLQILPKVEGSGDDTMGGMMKELGGDTSCVFGGPTCDGGVF